jgi:hypothetical protein
MSIGNNVSVKLPIPTHDGDREAAKFLKELRLWLLERNVKFSYIFVPEWSGYPYAINMRNEDALAFRLAFDL